MICEKYFVEPLMFNDVWIFLPMWIIALVNKESIIMWNIASLRQGKLHIYIYLYHFSS